MLRWGYTKIMQANDIKLVIFDLNTTLIDANAWPKFQQLMGMTETEDQTLWQLNHEGILPDRLWLEIVNNLYRQRGTHTQDEITRVLLDFAYADGAQAAVQAVQSRYPVALVSGAPDILVEHVAKDLGIDLFGSNALLRFDKQDIFQELRTLGEEATSKVFYLQSFCRRLGIQSTEVACVGDDENDIELFRHTQHGITFKGSTIANEAWKTIDTLANLSEIL
jgi:phosphoserine phosphatase